MSITLKIRNLWNYITTGKTKYYLHSPFIYQFYLNVLEGETDTQPIEKIRDSLYSSDKVVSFTDFGRGGVAVTKRVSELASVSAVSLRYGRVLYRAAAYFKPDNILELGTNLGIGTAYLAKGNSQAKVTTIEGGKDLSAIAKDNLQKLGLDNTNCICGEFDKVLPQVLATLPTVDMLFIDGNHHYKPTIQYFEACLHKMNENGVMIVDDIYWSEEMTAAWEYIKAHPRVTLTADIYRMGFVFLRPQQLAKEHFRLLYF